VAEVTGTATQDDLMQLRTDVAALQASSRQMKNQLDTLAPPTESRGREQGGESDRQTAALARRLDGLATSLTGLSTRVDDLSARVEALSRQPRGAAIPPASTAAPTGPPPSSASAPTTTSAPRSAPPGTATPTTPPAPTTASPTPTPGARSATGGLQPQDLYQAAYIDFTKGSYPLAITGFREFLRRYPEHQLAPSAQYWIGEAHLSQARGFADSGQNDRANEELSRAVQEFRKVLANYPRADKAPAALYKEALALIDMKQPALAQQRLQYLIETFPQAEETPLARERLAALRDR
jgi:tol-pal system protein YbgF